MSALVATRGGSVAPSTEMRRADVASTTRMPAISRRAIHCSESESLKTNSGSSHQLLELVPGAICFLAEDDDLVLALVEIESEASFNVAAIARAIMSAGDVIDVDQKSPALRVS